MRMKTCCAICALCWLSACAGNGEGLDENGRQLGDGDATLQPTFESIQDNVFTPVCTGCHAGAAAPLGLRLDEGASYALLVNAASAEVPALQRVQPGNPDASYLIQKIEGSAAVGARMPLNAPPLPQATIAVIRQWITDGATNAAIMGMTKTAVGAAAIRAVSPADGGVLSVHAPQIVMMASAELDTARLQAEPITLHILDSGTRVPIDVIVRTFQPTVLQITPQLLHAGSYELRISGADPIGLTDLANQPIDGDGDGAAGGDFVLHFTVEEAR